MSSSNEYMRVYMAERYARRIEECKQALGGRCVRCGTTEGLQFDHIDPKGKTYVITKRLAGVAKAKLAEELAKCQLLCWPCHKIKTNEDGSWGAVEHGGGASGKKNCPCLPCRVKKAQYMKEYSKRLGLEQDGTASDS